MLQECTGQEPTPALSAPQEKGHATVLQSCSSPGLLLTHQCVLLWFATTGNATPRNAQLWDHGTASSCTPEEPRS